MKVVSKYVSIKVLSDYLGIPVRTIRSLYGERKISVIKTGHRSLLFDPLKVQQELAAFEIRSVLSK